VFEGGEEFGLKRRLLGKNLSKNQEGRSRYGRELCSKGSIEKPKSRESGIRTRKRKEIRPRRKSRREEIMEEVNGKKTPWKLEKSRGRKRARGSEEG